jgi:hypothetical protein
MADLWDDAPPTSVEEVQALIAARAERRRRVRDWLLTIGGTAQDRATMPTPPPNKPLPPVRRIELL